MRIIFVMAYPIYHDGLTAEAWMLLHNQNRWIPGVLAEMGHEVEYWAGAHAPGEHTSHMEGFPDYPLRFFETDAVDRRTKFHQSRALVEAARRDPADLFLIKGVDGGLGVQLARRVLRPEHRPYAMITGGAFYHPIMRGAVATIYESDYQRRQLVQGAWTRPRFAPSDLIPMPKSVDTDHFRPMEGERVYDVLSASRLDLRNKSFDELGRLSNHHRVAVAGDGVDAEKLRARYPRIAWLGRVPNRHLPVAMNQSRLFLHNGKHDRRPTRDYFPRVLAEAMACGSVCIGFDDLIEPDVLPEECGVRVPRERVGAAVETLLADAARRKTLSEAARAHAVAHLGKRSSAPALQALLARYREKVEPFPST